MKAAVLVACLPALVHAQVFKCSANGATVYQARPCEATGARGQELRIQVAPGAPAAPAPEKPTPRPAPEPVAAPVPPPPPAPSRSWAELAGDACMEWYRPMLRDPRSAYYRNPSIEKDVVTLDIYATNGFGGYVSKAAACEIKNGAVDEGWTKIHAQRLKWTDR